MGFTVTGLAARVLMNAPGDVITRLSHMLLLVEVQGEPFIADTGFGGLTLTAPIRLVADIVQDTPHGPYRLLHRGETFLLQAKAKNRSEKSRVGKESVSKCKSRWSRIH